MIGHALALAAWTALFDEGLVVDPRPLFAALPAEALGQIMRQFPVQSGLGRIASAEACLRRGALRGPWEWDVVGVGLARVTYHLTAAVLPSTQDVYARDACYLARGRR